MFLVNVYFLLIALGLCFGRDFPDNFNFGFASASYQTEGAWNIDGKGESIWDNYTHRVPSPIRNGDNGDVACDSYHKYKEDIAHLSNLGAKYYRFSISWPRILPNGYANEVNSAGLQYYKNLVQELLKYNITPIATLYHWDLPQKLMEDGIDWTNVKLVDIFVDYARIVIKNLPNVAIWFTINEPRAVCHHGYGLGEMAPGIKSSGRLEYQCAYVIAKVHAATYHMFKNEFPESKARMTIVPNCRWGEPASPSTEDLDAAERIREFECGLNFHPIFAGGWPKHFQSRIDERSKAENYTKSRLPSFTQEEIDFIKGTYDFLAINHYTAYKVSAVEEAPYDSTSYLNDIRANYSFYPSTEVGANGNTVNPWSLRKTLNWLVQQFGQQEILVTETGIADDGSTLIDDSRIKFYTGMYCALLEAIYEDNINVVGIINWSWMDNFEWASGYWPRFGFYHVNYSDPLRTRTPKKSVGFIKDLIRTKKLKC